ncbi:MAG: DoxX family membrane protein [Anaerolineaceae bacterium]|nr:DoxX family membrane protein [Anaerolineaceae bacterium]
MNNLKTRFDQQFNTIDRQITHLMAQYGLPLMRVSLGIVFLWFGALKLLPGLSPAEELVRNTTFFVNPDWFIPLLAVWEMAIGLGLIFGKAMRLTLLLLFLQMPGTMLPLFVLPEAVWTQFPHALTMEGQYIIKNLVLVAAGMVLGGTVRGGYLEPEPGKLQTAVAQPQLTRRTRRLMEM